MKSPENEPMMKSQKGFAGIFYKILRLFTVVYPGEALTAFLLSFNIFLFLTSYYILKPIRKALILTGQTAEIETYLYAAMAILLIFVVKAFSSLSSKVSRQLLITWVTLFFISNLVLFYVLYLLGTPVAVMGVIFFIWVGIFNNMIVAQFWGFTNDIYTQEAGKRLFPLVMLGQNIGAIAGGAITFFLVESLGLYQMMLVAGAFLGICILLTFIIHKREIKRTENKKEVNQVIKKEESQKIEDKPLEKGGGFQLVFKSRYLLYIAFLILLLNVVNTTGEYIRSDVFDRKAEAAIQSGEIQKEDEAQYLAKLESGFLSIVNISTLLIQLLLVSRILKWFGVRWALLFLPFIALGGYFLIALGASFIVVYWAKAMENSTDYSLMNTLRGALYLITSREEKYKAKAAIDTFFVRAGDVFVGIIVFLGTTYLAFNTERFATLNVFIALIWIILCFLIIREHKKLSEKGEYSPGK
jgi:AAA family ATP:ADP antiporter